MTRIALALLASALGTVMAAQAMPDQQWPLAKRDYAADIEAARQMMQNNDGQPDCVVSNACYNDPEPLGCFPQGPSTVWCKDGYAPMTPTQMNSKFKLFTTLNQNREQEIDYFNLNATILAVSQIDWSKGLIMIVHGLGASGNWQRVAKDTLYDNGYDLNVLNVYWTGGSESFYPQSVANTRVIGAMMGLVLSRIDTLIPQFDLQKTTVAGMSLGGHIIGFCANWVQQNHGVLLPFLNGIDPAGPWYEGYPPETRLDPTDAKFVQAFHTNGEPLAHVPPGYGSHEAMGHVDFFVNDGQEQPGCREVADVTGCSHKRSISVWIASFSVKNNPQCQQYHAFPGDWHSPDSWNQGLYFDTAHSCNNFGIDYRTQGSCSGSYYFGSTDGKYKAIVDYFGSQYKFTFNFPTSGFFNPTGKVEIQFYYNGVSEPVKATEAVFNDQSISLEGTMKTIFVTPCDSNSVSANGVPDKIGFTYLADATSTSMVSVNSVVITKVDGTCWTISNSFSMNNGTETVETLS